MKQLVKNVFIKHNNVEHLFLLVSCKQTKKTFEQKENSIQNLNSLITRQKEPYNIYINKNKNLLMRENGEKEIEEKKIVCIRFIVFLYMNIYFYKTSCIIEKISS